MPLTLWLAAEALVALASARMMLHQTRPEDILRRNDAARRHITGLNDSIRGETADEGCHRIAFIIPRAARRVPWRADCLVQAMAGQDMLRRRGIATAVTVGTAKQADGTFQSHAWLLRGDIVVLGGDVSGFEPLLQSGQTGGAKE